MSTSGKRLVLLLLLLSAGLAGCAHIRPPEATSEAPSTALYRPLTASAGDKLLARFTPYFEVRDYQRDYNRIGAAAARPAEDGDYRVYVDTSRPTIYTLEQKFSTPHGIYTNLIYRVHFPEVPWPHLTWGKNVGLLVYVTVNERNDPILITTLNTCGCYLAMIPTSKLPRQNWPKGWPNKEQIIYGERLPATLVLPESEPYGHLVITLAGETHRVSGDEFRQSLAVGRLADPGLLLAPMASLDQLPLGERQVSFFEK